MIADFMRIFCKFNTDTQIRVNKFVYLREICPKFFLNI